MWEQKQGCGKGNNQREVRVPFEQRLLLHTKIHHNGCLEWTGALTAGGYGRTRYGGKQMGAHRAVWVFNNGTIPEGLCDNPRCVNPDHLFLGTHRDNTQDMVTKGRAYYGGRKTPVVGKNNPRHILTESQVLEIRKIGYEMTQQQLAEKFGVSRSCVRDIRLGINWSHLTDVRS